jgi:hypothetical protein
MWRTLMAKKKAEVQQLLFELANNGELGEGAIRGELQVLATMASKAMAEEIRLIVENGNCNLRETILELSGIKMDIPDDEDEPVFKVDERVLAKIGDDSFPGIITKVDGTIASVLFDDGDTGDIDFSDLTLEANVD